MYNIDKTVSILEKVILKGQESIKLLNEQSFDSWNLIVADLLDRFISTTNTAVLLIKHHGDSANNRQSLMILLRASIQDYLIINYLYSYYFDAYKSVEDKDKNTFENRLSRLYSDQLRYSIEHLLMLKEAGILKNDTYILSIKSLGSKYPQFFNIDKIDFEKPKESLLFDKFPSNKDIFKRLNSHKIAKRFSHLFDYYTMFSKVEHYGLFSRDLKLSEDSMNAILDSLEYIIHGQYLCLNILEKKYDIKMNSISINKLGKDLANLNNMK